jgi:HPt (histidine-containing phosphotransfer) domain-containing protein
MLLYNQSREFIGIDDEGLKLLNYSTLEELLSVCTDVADLFANQPGYVHNFKNFSWIDFLLHAAVDASSAIVHANGRVFSCQLTVSSLYLCESPTQNSYMIEMSHIKTLSGEEIKPHTITLKDSKIEPLSQSSIPASSLPSYSDITPMELKEPTVLDIPDSTISEFDDIELEKSLSYSEVKQELFEEDILDNNPFKEDILRETLLAESSLIKPVSEPEVISKPKKLQDKPMLGSARYNSKEQAHLDNHHVDKNYKFDPQVAANELGLPVDLIEEFIGDFIQQAYDFKEDLFEAAAKGDFSNLHILSHKLKGVAANLRIEDAFETLSVINSSTDTGEIDANLKYYYDIVLKLEGKTLPMDEPQEQVSDEVEEDIYSFGLKQYENESIIVHDDELELNGGSQAKDEDRSVFEKEYLDLDKDVQETEVESVLEIPDQTTKLTLDYDPQIVAKSLGVELSFMEELLFDYKNDSRIISNQINQAIKAFDTHACNESAAKLKGISDNLRLDKISDELAILSKTHDAQEAKKASVRLNTYLDQL